MRIGERIADLHANFGRRDLITRKYVFAPMFDRGVFLWKWDSGDGDSTAFWFNDT